MRDLLLTQSNKEQIGTILTDLKSLEASHLLFLKCILSGIEVTQGAVSEGPTNLSPSEADQREREE